MERKEALEWLFSFASLAKDSAIERAVYYRNPPGSDSRTRKDARTAHQCQYLSLYSPTARYAGEGAAQGQAR